MTDLNSIETEKRSDRDNDIRDEVVEQLRESLVLSRKYMFDEELTITERQHWTRVHTNTAQVLNTILRDQQFREWERRMKDLEESGVIAQTSNEMT